MVLASLTLLPGLLVAFWAGVVSFASPCFLPVVPVFITYLAGKPTVKLQTESSDDPVPAGQDAVLTKAETKRTRVIDWVGAGQAVAFMVAFSVVFLALWTMITMVGHLSGDFRQWLRIGAGIVLIIIGLHVTGLITIGPLERVLQPRYSPDRASKPNLRRSILLGLAFGAGWTPCIGPILGGVLALASSSNSPATGILLMSVYSLGLGLPFVLICAGASSLLNRLSWFTAHQRVVNLVVGLFIVIIGFLLMADLFTRLSNALAF